MSEEHLVNVEEVGERREKDGAETTSMCFRDDSMVGQIQINKRNNDYDEDTLVITDGVE